MPERKLISEADVRSAAREGRTQLHAGEKTIVTPLARDALRELGVELVRRPRGSAAGPRAPRDTVPATIAGTSDSGVSTTKFNSSGRAAARVRTTAMPGAQRPKSAQPDGCECGTDTAATGVIAIGSDHGGFEMKADLKKAVESLGWAIDDVGTHSAESCDYPDFAYAVARTVSTGGADLGIMIDGAGPGSAIACNKVPGIRAACVHDEFTAWNARAHNDANVITLGSRGIGAEVARRIVRVYLETAFEGGRHARRVEKLSDIEARFVAKRM